MNLRRLMSNVWLPPLRVGATKNHHRGRDPGLRHTELAISSLAGPRAISELRWRRCRAPAVIPLSDSTIGGAAGACCTARFRSDRCPKPGRRRPVRLAHDASALRSVCASAISGTRGSAKSPWRRREQGMSVRETTRGIIKSCQIKSCAQLKTARLLLLRDGDCSEQCILGRCRIRWIALEQNLVAASSPADVFMETT